MNKINASKIQRKGLKDIYEVIDKYPIFEIENNRQEKKLYITKYSQNLGEIIQIIKKNKKILNDKGVTRVYIFGSLAKGKADINSDIDVAYEIEEEKGQTISDLISRDKIVKDILNKINNLDLHNFKSLKPKIISDIKEWGIRAF